MDASTEIPFRGPAAGPVHSPAAAPPAATITLGRRAIVTGLVAMQVLVLLLHLVVVATNLAGIEMKGKERLYFDNEGNLPSYFSTLILFLAAVLLAVIARFKRAEKDRFALRWVVLSAVFFGLCADEALSFHEMLIDPLRNTFHLSGFMRFPWVLAGALFVGVFAIFFFSFWRALPPRTRLTFALSGTLYVVGAIGFEMISGPFLERFQAGGSSAGYMAAMTIEETLEMSAIVLFIHALLGYLEAFRPSFQVRIE